MKVERTYSEPTLEKLRFFNRLFRLCVFLKSLDRFLLVKLISLSNYLCFPDIQFFLHTFMIFGFFVVNLQCLFRPSVAAGEAKVFTKVIR